MTEQRERLERALRGCAEAGVSDPVDLWPAVRERVSGQIGQGRTRSEDHGRAGAVGHSRPVSSVALILAILSITILGAIVYVAAGPLRGPARHGPPTGESRHVDRDGGMRSGDTLSELRKELNQTRTMDGMKVTLRWAYADEKFVAVGLETQRLEGTRGSEDPVLEPALWDDSVGDEARLPPYVKITDASGQDFDTVGGGTNGEHADVTFDAPKGLSPGRGHRFRLEVHLGTAAGGRRGEEPEAGPFFFDFEVPVLPAPTIEVDQAVEARGTTLTLERVVDSPLLPQAVVCFGPPDDEHSWMPFLPYDESYEKGVGSVPQELGNGCWSLQMVASENLSPVTVTNLEGFPNDPPSDPGKAGAVDPKTIHGPWRFDFEVPETPGS